MQRQHPVQGGRHFRDHRCIPYSRSCGSGLDGGPFHKKADGTDNGQGDAPGNGRNAKSSPSTATLQIPPNGADLVNLPTPFTRRKIRRAKIDEGVIGFAPQDVPVDIAAVQASSVTLSQLINSFSITTSCRAVLNQAIPGCQTSDFNAEGGGLNQQSRCSQTCENGLSSIFLQLGQQCILPDLVTGFNGLTNDAKAQAVCQSASLPASSLPPSSLASSIPPSSLPASSVASSLPPSSIPTTTLPPTSVPATTLPPSSLPPSSVASSLPPSSVPTSTLPPSSLPPSSLPPSSSLPNSSPPSSLSPTPLSSSPPPSSLLPSSVSSNPGTSSSLPQFTSSLPLIPTSSSAAPASVSITPVIPSISASTGTSAPATSAGGSSTPLVVGAIFGVIGGGLLVAGVFGVLIYRHRKRTQE